MPSSFLASALRLNLFRSLLTALSLLTLSAHANDFATFNQRFGQQPVEVEVMQAGRPTGQTWTLLGFADGELEARLPGGGEMVLEPTRALADQLRFPAFATDIYAAAIRAGRYGDALGELRPRVYPLLRFGALPSGFTRLHDAIAALLQTLTDAGQLDENLAIYKAYPELIKQRRYQVEALRVIQVLSNAGDTDKAVGLLATIPLEGLEAGLMSALMTFAYDLRVRGEFEALIPVYEAMIPELEGNLIREAQIWLAYSHAAIEQNAESEAIFNTIDAPASKDDGFGLYQLLIGYRLYRQDQFADALDAFAQGLVFSQANESWIPEALYYIGRAYHELKRLTPARNTFEEIFRLFPENQWAARAREQYEIITREIEALQVAS